MRGRQERICKSIVNFGRGAVDAVCDRECGRRVVGALMPRCQQAIVR
jgi:hypothetical protein